MGKRVEKPGDATPSSLASLVPRLATELGQAEGNIYACVDGSMLSADISGFTALSEKLADKGKAGAEEITELINRCFDALIEAAYDYSGEVLKFGGDAILVLFRGDLHGARAAAAGATMQAALRESFAAKRAQLSMTVGVAEGPFDVFLVGSEHRELLITGDAASLVIELEGQAEKGDTLVSSRIASQLSDDLLAPSPVGHKLTGAPEVRRVEPPARVASESLEHFVPPEIRDHFAAFEHLGGEHRIITVGFLSVSGIGAQITERGGQAVANELGYLVDQITDACTRYGVSPLHTDISPDGVKFLMCAGAPVTHGPPSDAMLQTALDIADVSSPFTLKQGVQTGRAFAGFLGTGYRRTYTLMGDAVNTAARMLGPAQHRDIVAVEDVVKSTRTEFLHEELEPFHVKGKTEPVHACRIIAPTDEGRRGVSTPLIGREALMSTLTEALEEGGKVVEIAGPAGAGKSRLVEALREVALERGMAITGAQCSPFSQATPFTMLRLVMRRVLGIDLFADGESAGDVLLKVITHHTPELAPIAPIIAIPLGATVPDTPEADAIDPKFLRSRINDACTTLMRAVIDPHTLILLEDVHWIDDPSAEFFEHGLRAQRGDPWMAVLTRRPEGQWEPDFAEESFTHIDVEPLTSEDIHTLVIAASDRHLTDQQIQAVVTQAEGNPLFAIELARGITDTESVPDTVEQLIGVRMDRLEPNVRHALRVAAVFGYRLKEDDLRAVLHPLPLPRLNAVEEFIKRRRGGALTFTHALYRDVAYEGLPFGERRRLHLTVGNQLEKTVEDPSIIASLLALHFSEAKDRERTWRYGVLAGDTAANQTANVEAAASYTRALEVAAHLRTLDLAEVNRVALALGDAETIVGDFELSERAYNRARKRPHDLETELTAMIRLGRLREKQGKFAEAAKWYNRVADRIDGDTEAEKLLLVRSEMHYQRSGLLHRKGEQQGCIIEARKALGTGEDANDLKAMADALQRLHLATIYLGRTDRIGYGLKALDLYQELGDFERQASVLNNLGIQSYFDDDWDSAAAYYRRATEAGTQAGSMIDGLMGGLNGAEILSDQGHWDDAISMLENVLRNWEAAEYRTGIAAAKLFLGVAVSRTGDDDERAGLLLDEAKGLIHDLGLEELELDARIRIIQHEEDGAAARTLLRELPVDHVLRGRLLRVIGAAAHQDGSWSDVREEIIAAIDSMAGYERAVTLELLTTREGAAADPAWSEEAQSIFDELGVVRLRPLAV